ncbi:hypothetical protein MRB53_005276 [Persea americana]|uniref:Uncharacterized protein n=1 Tax=Persea americana TaxID=3435 RepID=A0ACC2MDM8_PERAE|nr:hypothetical protein MRB53_005276 [Persea americana]
MKYLINEWGIEKFRSVVEQYYGKKFEPFRELPEWEFKSYLGWHEQANGVMFCGLHVDNGRIGGKMKTTLREIIENPSRQLLPRVPFCNLGYVDPLNLTAMACPALPLCPLAITEAKCGIPNILKRVRAVFDKVGLKYNESLVIRITGCPNGCARPYMAELGLVGDGPNSYQVWLGGTPNQTTLAKCFMNKVKIQDLEKVLEPLFYSWKRKHQWGESFGDFTTRMGFDNLQEIVEKWEGLVERSSRSNLKLFVDKETYEAMDSLAKLQNKNIHQLAMEVICNFVAAEQNEKSERSAPF